MQYYNNEISQKYPKLLEYFSGGISDNDKNISHCLLFWGPDITSQCELALEVARLLNCSEDKSQSCNCLNCRWIKEQTHPAVKIYTRLDFKEADGGSESHPRRPGGSGPLLPQCHPLRHGRHAHPCRPAGDPDGEELLALPHLFRFVVLLM